jgi:hypothetical protein
VPTEAGWCYARFYLEVTALNPYRFAVKQGVSHFLPRRGQHPLEGGTGDIHPLGARRLLQAFQVFKAYCLGFFDRETDFS